MTHYRQVWSSKIYICDTQFIQFYNMMFNLRDKRLFGKDARKEILFKVGNVMTDRNLV